MNRSKVISLFVVTVFAFSLALGCAQKKDHWGQKFDINKKWWKKEGQSWDRKNNIFMTVGYSNPDWIDEFDLRRSADLDARAQVAAFMRSLVDNYMEEVRGRRFAVSESVVKASSRETVVGSVIVARHKIKKKEYRSLIKVDLNYFFDQIYDQYVEDTARRIRRRNARMPREELDQLIKDEVAAALDELRAAEMPVIEKTFKERESL
jgi:hypothetical protein